MKCTIVSVVPFYIKEEEKPGLTPSLYKLPSSKDGKLGLLTIDEAKRAVFIDGDRGSMYMHCPAEDIAKSLVFDYSIAQPAQDSEAGPGLFYVNGEFTDEKIVREKYKAEVIEAENRQKRWFIRLVQLADDTFARTKRLSLISDLDRTACRFLGLKREWLSDDPTMMFNCPVCVTVVSNLAAVCFACHAILKPEEIKKYQFLGGAVAPPVQAVNTSGVKA